MKNGARSIMMPARTHTHQLPGNHNNAGAGKMPGMVKVDVWLQGSYGGVARKTRPVNWIPSGECRTQIRFRHSSMEHNL
jgi:hypothetical protein